MSDVIRIVKDGKQIGKLEGSKTVITDKKELDKLSEEDKKKVEQVINNDD